MALKLKGSTSGFVAIDAPSVAGNNTLILPENTGSAQQLLGNDITAGVVTFTSVTVNRNGDLTVPGTISIGGTITYEDVTSVDSIGIVTARGLSIFGNTTGLNATGVSTFVDGTTIANSGVNANKISLPDSTDGSLNIGVGSDFKFSHDGTHSYITEVGTGNLYIQGSNIIVRDAGTLEKYIEMTQNGSVDIYHNGTKKFETNSTGVTVSGDVDIADKLIHTGDTDTFLEFGTNTIMFDTGGAERLRIDSSGKVLVNTTTASTVGNCQYSRLQVSGNSSNAAGPSHISLKRGTVSTSLSDGDTLARLIFSSLDGGDYAYIQASVDGSPGTSDFPGRLMFFTCADDASSATERLRINSEGAVHINDGSATAARFEVGNGGDLKLFHTNPNSYIQDGSSSLSISSARIDLTSPSGENMARLYQDASVELYHNNVKKFETTSTGVKVTSDSSSNGLYVNHSNGNEVARLAHNGSGDEGVMILRDSGTVTVSMNGENGQVCHITGPAALMLGTGGSNPGNSQRGISFSAVTSGNPVLINTSSAHYTGGAYSHWYIYDDHGRVGYVNADGDGTASYNSESDYRLKENVVPITDGIEKLKTLKPYRFNFIGYDTSKVVQGFYAHEVSEAVPNAVKGTKDEMKSLYYEEGDTIPDGKAVGDFKEYSTTEMNPQGLDHAKMVPLLTAALQEEVAKREALEARVAALEG